ELERCPHPGCGLIERDVELYCFHQPGWRLVIFETDGRRLVRAHRSGLACVGLDHHELDAFEPAPAIWKSTTWVFDAEGGHRSRFDADHALDDAGTAGRAA